jgi:hypothetical protein
MNKAIFLILGLLVLVAVVPLFAHGNKPTPVEKFFETAGKHPHAIAVNAGDRAWAGTACAAAHSPVIAPAPGGDDGKGGKDCKGGKNGKDGNGGNSGNSGKGEVKPGKK